MTQERMDEWNRVLARLQGFPCGVFECMNWGLDGLNGTSHQKSPWCAQVFRYNGMLVSDFRRSSGWINSLRLERNDEGKIVLHTDVTLKDGTPWKDIFNGDDYCDLGFYPRKDGKLTISRMLRNPHRGWFEDEAYLMLPKGWARDAAKPSQWEYEVRLDEQEAV